MRGKAAASTARAEVASKAETFILSDLMVMTTGALCRLDSASGFILYLAEVPASRYLRWERDISLEPPSDLTTLLETWWKLSIARPGHGIAWC